MEEEYKEDYTIAELLACFISREIEDGESLAVGAALPVPRAGVLLAHLHHGPNMRVIYARTRTNLFQVPVLESFQFLADWRGSRWAEADYIHEEAYDTGRWTPDLFFVGGLQIDKFGNTNLLGLGPDFKKLKFRGAGGVGTCTASSMVKRYYLLSMNHDKRVLVDKCDYISAMGWGQGGKDARVNAGVSGGGPKYCLTPLCIMDFDEETKHMRLKSLHPGVTVDKVIENTGFKLIIPDNVPTTAPPTRREIEILRNRVDKEGNLRK